MKPILEVRGISKKFKIQHEQQPYLSLRDSFSNLFSKNKSDEEFWALKDVSFDVYPGDSIGILGRNGAGKSTLLKIFSKITPPTSGSIISRGRIASLLEVGTGFHSELSGRENIYLNGSILGLKRIEINRQFDAIVDFSGVEKFLDTPLKHYSSGMQLRLAFAVAAHLEPEILIIDEVLAVGDAEFQKKCIGKMDEVSKDGRTILFVSHNIISLQALSKKGLFLNQGQTDGMTSLNDAISKYINGDNDEIPSSFYKRDLLQSNSREVFISEAKIINQEGLIANRFKVSEDIIIEIVWENKAGLAVTPNFLLKTVYNSNVLMSLDTTVDFDGSLKSSKGVYKSNAVIPKNMLNAGDFLLFIALDGSSPRICFESLPEPLRFSIWDPMDEYSIARGSFTSITEDVPLWSALNWKFEKID